MKCCRKIRCGKIADAAAKQFAKFDADSNGQLDLDEVTKRLEAKAETLK